MSVPLSGVELLRLCTVLQDCADQLSVLGHIMPDTYRGRPEANMVVSADIGQVLEQQKRAEQNLKAARQFEREAGGLSDATRELHRSQKELNRTLEENPLSPDNLAKVQRDRQFVAHVITDVLAELQERGTFHSLVLAVEEEKRRKANLLDIIIREEEGRRRTKALQRQLLDIHKEKSLELQRREEMTAHLKDQLQEMKAKTGLERKYVKSSAELLVYQGQKTNIHAEKQLEDEIRLLQERLEEERRVHMEMETFLKEHQTSLGEKLEVWMERYERDMEDKQQELNSLRNNKANNLSQLQELAKKYRDSEQVVIEDRLEKEARRRQLEMEHMERDAATKIQSWWRGTLVRRGLGPFKKGKKPKSKEGKKGKKKK
ncbi:dynein regulatory complex protein 9 [Coregonus clupeaformis]|uniref:dynein regulatory complex protein 9 n=1 Tax=Coregonus clupeaformis TaxID=59861 RepID=UPI001BDF9D72|nr:dynein regulatory complex protein 9 [Coregonus clupeaformis]XP_041733172.1 dynein regulatory complex protein 9 [Coregonus clupeaformis]